MNFDIFIEFSDFEFHLQMSVHFFYDLKEFLKLLDLAYSTGKEIMATFLQLVLQANYIYLISSVTEYLVMYYQWCAKCRNLQSLCLILKEYTGFVFEKKLALMNPNSLSSLSKTSPNYFLYFQANRLSF